MLAEFGLSEPRNRCLDFIPDGCVNADDLNAWEFREALNRCPSDQELRVSSTETFSIMNMFSQFSDVTASAQDSPLLIAGKPNTFKGVSSMPDTLLYNVNTDGLCVGPGTEIAPISSNTISGYSRLVTDGQGNVYQVHGERGLISPDTGKVVIASGRKNKDEHSESAVFNQNEINSVLIGLENGEGLPLLDVAFDPSEADVVYVVPVQVNDSYAAAAKLRLKRDENTYTGDYDILALYSETSSNVVTNPDNTEHVVSEPDYQHLHEIEVDVDGMVYVLSSHTEHSASRLVGNSWLLVFDKQGGLYRDPVDLHKMGLIGPTAMTLSSLSIQKTMYFASSIVGQGDLDQLTTHIYSLELTDIGNLEPDELTLGVIEIECPPPTFCNTHPHLYDPNEGCVAVITSISAHPSNGDLYVNGFVAPRFSESYTFPVDQIVEFFTTPILATIPPGAETEGAKIIEGANLALPLSIVWTGNEEHSASSNSVISSNGYKMPLDYLSCLTQLWLR